MFLGLPVCACMRLTGVDLLESADPQKDQTLFLSQIHQRALRRTMFPVGQYKKSFVKQLAREAGLDHIVRKKEVFKLTVNYYTTTTTPI